MLRPLHTTAGAGTAWAEAASSGAGIAAGAGRCASGALPKSPAADKPMPPPPLEPMLGSCSPKSADRLSRPLPPLGVRLKAEWFVCYLPVFWGGMRRVLSDLFDLLFRQFSVNFPDEITNTNRRKRTEHSYFYSKSRNYFINRPLLELT